MTYEEISIQDIIDRRGCGGGLLSIVDDLEDNNWDCIVFNLLATPKKKFYTFWLTKGNK